MNWVSHSSLILHVMRNAQLFSDKLLICHFEGTTAYIEKSSPFPTDGKLVCFLSPKLHALNVLVCKITVISKSIFSVLVLVAKLCCQVVHMRLV